jgi:hypothetical protein
LKASSLLPLYRRVIYPKNKRTINCKFLISIYRGASVRLVHFCQFNVFVCINGTSHWSSCLLTQYYSIFRLYDCLFAERKNSVQFIYCTQINRTHNDLKTNS